MILIRESRLDDIEPALPLFRKMHAEVMEAFGVPFNEIAVRHTMVNVIDYHVAITMEYDSTIIGFMAGMIGGMMFDPFTRTVFECAWWIEPKHRGQWAEWMLNYFEQQCRKRGVKKMVIGHTGMKSWLAFKKYYEGKGFKLFENHYIKDLV